MALGSMQFVLDEGERNDWFDDGTIVLFTVSAIVGLIGFVTWELYGTKTPIVDLRVFRYRNVRVGVPTAILLGTVVFGPIVMIPQYVQNVLGFTATMAGLLILIRALPVFFVTPFIARIATLVDQRILLVAGFSLSAVSFVMLASHMTSETETGALFVPLLVSGIGQSMLLVPLLTAVYSGVKPADAPKASSLVSLSVQLGGSIASTLLVTIFDRRTSFHSDIYRGNATIGNPLMHHLLAQPHALARIARLLQLQAANAGFADAIFALAPVALAAIAIVTLIRPLRAKLAAPIAIAE